MEEKVILNEENSELFEHFRIEVDPGQALTRIDKFLFNRIQNASRNKIQSAARAGNILVNKQPVKSNYKVRPNDVISIVLSHPPRHVEIIPEDIPLDIHYEDDDIIIINKQAGLVVHPGHGNFTGTLLHGLAHYFKQSGQKKVENGFGYLVHRIDKNTTGLLLVAKNEEAQTKLAKQFFIQLIQSKIPIIMSTLAFDEVWYIYLKLLYEKDNGKGSWDGTVLKQHPEIIDKYKPELIELQEKIKKHPYLRIVGVSQECVDSGTTIATLKIPEH